MNSVKKSIIFAILSVVLLVSVSQSATPLPVVDISGGEGHTLVLGQNGQAFACGERSRTVEGTPDPTCPNSIICASWSEANL